MKTLKGYTSELAKDLDDDSTQVEWVMEPPEEVRCMPDWQHQSWRPWNETLL